jgi:photosystem II stability/assembly factor-like uncharacterized protein
MSKKLFQSVILTLLITSSAVYSQQPWSRVSPLPQENTINDITKIPGTNRLMAVCEGSTIMTTDDAGETWAMVMNPAGRNNQYVCKGVHFISETTGFINGAKETILKTTDGGQTWNLKYQGNTAYDWQYINDLSFCNDNHGFAVGDHGKLLETTDAGESWQAIESGVQENLRQIVFADSLTGFIFQGNINCLKTTDGGQSWNAGPLAGNIQDGTFYDCLFTNPLNGFIFVNVYSPTETTGYIYRTNDAGANWDLVYQDGSAYSGKFAFFNAQQGMIACMTADYQTKILLTDDAGLTWNLIEQPWLPWYSTNALICPVEETAIAAGFDGKIFKSTDGGEVWQQKQIKLIPGNIYDMQFLNQENGYALVEMGSFGVTGVGIERTTDGGDSWEYIYEYYMGNFVNFFFLSPDTGFIATLDFNTEVTFLKTTDGGENWEEYNTGFELNPLDIRFFDQDNGLICGQYQVIRTSDGGITWTDVTPENTSWSEYNKIAYRSLHEVYIAGCGEYPETIISKSIDGGLTWQSSAIGGYGVATGIAIPDENTLIVMTGDFILKSIDDGLNWYQTEILTDTDFVLYSILFTSPLIGYATCFGEYYSSLKTTNGGETWFPLVTNESSALYGAWFFDDENGIMFGDKGIIIETSTGGVTGTHNPQPGMAENTFLASPNPFADEITLRQVPGKTIVNPVQFELTDATGRIILEKRTESSNTGITIPGSGLKPGLYICRIQSGNRTLETLKLIKLN